MRDTRSILKHDWDSAVAEGRTMTLDAAVVHARNEANADHEAHSDTGRADQAASAPASR